MKNVFITTAIPYVNASAHIGHVQEFLLADTLKRIWQANGHTVYLQSGTDDNSLKNVLAAEKLNQPVAEYVSAQSVRFKSLLSSLGIEPDFFVNTASKTHHQAVQGFISSLDPVDLYESIYEGKYCVGCEDFIREADLVDGHCADHKKAPEIIQEHNVFFKLSRYQDQIYRLIESDEIKITPIARKKEILSFISQGLTDISISRPKADGKPQWGIDFPNYPKHTVYVWIDALINYLTGIGYGQQSDWKKIWSESYKIHVIGKNVWKFHAIYWIGLLLSAQISVPNELVIHGFLTNEGVKISKSLNNTIDPVDVLGKVSPDLLRTYLLGKLNYERDADFSFNDLAGLESELANVVGNLYPRLWTISSRADFTLEPKFASHPPLDPRSIGLHYRQLIKTAQELNQQINDSKIWTWTSRPLQQEQLRKWNNQLDEISLKLAIFFPQKLKLIQQAYWEKTIIFPKKS